MNFFKKFLYSSAMFLMSLLICALLSEAVVRVLLRDKVGIFPRFVTGAEYGDFKIRRNIPHASYRHKSIDGEWDFKINAQGFRSEKEFSYEKPKNTKRILVLGDSYTIGYEVNREESYSAVLEQTLREKGMNVEVINAGVSGFSTAEALVFLEQEGLKYQPDAVVLGFYANDLDDNVRADLYRLKDGELILNKKEYLPAIKQRDSLDRIPGYRWLSEHSYLHNYLNQAATLFVKHKVESKNRLEAAGASESAEYQGELAASLVNRIYEICRQRDIDFILLDIPAFDTFQPAFPKPYSGKEFADVFVSGRDLLAPHSSEGPLYRPHAQRHWTPISHRLAGEKLAAVLSQRWKEKEL